MNIYIDASFDKYTRVSFIGWTTGDLLINGVDMIRSQNINQAEMSALCSAVRKLGVNNIFYTDSMHVVRNCACDNVIYIPRAKNIADGIVNISKELYLNRKRNR